MSFTDWYFYPAVTGLILLLIFIQYALKGKEARSNQLMKTALLFFSYLSMGLYDYRFCLCITAVILITYLGGLGLVRLDKRRKRCLTVLTVISLLSILGVFKYLDFFMGTLAKIAGKEWNAFRLILPIGISFYIFSAIGYVLDVSWGNMEAERSLLDMALFLSFFPKLLCGPIVAGRDFLPQLKEQRRVTAKNMKVGIQIFIFGLFKKVVLADHLGVFVDDVFGAALAYDTFTVWLAVFSSFLQLYFDFSGYSDMAIGISKILGYEIGRNFNVPFAARNIREFWNRWHISLSSWFRDYLYIPLGGNKKGYARECLNRMLVFLVSGLWHGAGFTFIIWGFCHGMYTVFYAVYANWVKRHHRKFVEHKGRFLLIVKVLANYLLLNIIQVFFRADSLEHAIMIFGRMFFLNPGIHQPYAWTFLAYVLLISATLAAYWKRRPGVFIDGFYPLQDLNTFKGCTLFLAFCELTFLFAYSGKTFFSYANF